MVDPYNQAYIVLLGNAETDEVLPIWVEKPQAKAIGMALEKVSPPRPMTHDLLNNLVTVLGAKALSVVINDLKENTFYATLHLLHGDGELTLDTRPSDGIALALRADCPIFVDDEMLQKNPPTDLERWLENLKPEDFRNAD